MKRYQVNEAGTEVTDTLTGLVWSQKTIAIDVDAKDALSVAAAFGEGWRVPTVDELQTIVDRTKRSPAIDTEAFPDTKNDWYWTSTPVTGYEESARWVVGFSYGVVSYYDIFSGACVRAVRGGQ